MERKDNIDLAGATMLVVFALVLAFNQIVIKVANGGFQPVFQAGLRSAGAFGVLLLWMRWRGIRLQWGRGVVWAGLLSAVLFTVEFIALYWALDHTTVSRASIIFYSMPVHLSLAAHFLLPNERLSRTRMAGLLLAMGGVIWVLLDRRGGAASLSGDLAALVAALGWAGIALTVRITPLATVRAETQLFWQLLVSAVLLLAVAPLFGDLTRDPEWIHVAGLGFQVIAIASFGYLAWFMLMKIYPASSVASFSFLSPVFAVLMGWGLLGEPIGPQVIGGLALVAVGLTLINRRVGA